MFRKITLSSLALILIVSLSSCQHAPRRPRPMGPEPQNLCRKYQFLQAYQCSFDKAYWAASRGDINAQYAVGYMYYYGISVAPDEKQAVKWIERSAKAGNPQARSAMMLLMPPQKVVPAKVVTPAKRKPPQVRPVRVAKTPPPKVAPKVVLGKPTCMNKEGYTIQLAGAPTMSKLQGFMKANRPYLKDHIYVYSRKTPNAPWYILTYGHYSTYVDAKKDLDALPKAVKEGKAWIKPCASLMP
jgi:septal ring-binding cell division protein DamX